jgi:hypothetical protein
MGEDFVAYVDGVIRDATPEKPFELRLFWNAAMEGKLVRTK